jgi:myosin protein heavy chain
MQSSEGDGTKQLGLLERQILQANPILEAFGNAQTIRNNNSSRFGKFVRIEFTSTGCIAGANIDWYLLEKSRVHNRSEAERSFHVFYQLLRSGDRDLLSKLLLTGTPGDYAYLKSSRQNVEGLDDGVEWKALRTALDTVGFSPEEQLNFFRVVASILQIGNIQLAEDRSGTEQARIDNSAHIEKVCHLLGVPEQELTKALLRPRVKAGREWVSQSRTRKQVLEETAALCKTMYEKTFGAIVERINSALDRPTSKSTFIGVLDIAGFEIFEVNSFEQLCINYTNEKLQQFFNHHMFVLEQEEYARESIEWDFVNFGLDLQPTIDLIESTSPIGILSCLDEECIMPKATDETFTEKCNRTWATKRDGSAQDEAAAAAAAQRGVAHGSSKYVPSRFAAGFTIKHYAGNVEYRTEGWLDKNKDPLNDNLTRVMSESNDRFIASLFSDFAVDDDQNFGTPSKASSPVKRRPKRGAFRTLAQKHKEQLNSLMNQLASTQPHFVRCIVPNAERKPGKMHLPLVLEQLRCNGVLEGIRIARLGYPNRLLFTEFRTRYEVLTPDIIPRGYMDGRKACQRMTEALELNRDVFKIGLTKIFFKAGALAELEARRDALLYDIFARFQGACRMFTARRQMKKILNRSAAVRTIQRNARLYVQLREWPWWQLYTKIRPLLTATRHDEELKRKELELAMITERAERDQKEREMLEALRFALESEKKRVEEELASERALLADKDDLLMRSKQRESTLEDELASMQADIDQLDDQLERALTAQKTAEASRSELQTAFDQAAEHLVRLEAAEKIWKTKELILSSQLSQRTSEFQKLSAEREELNNIKSELERRVKESSDGFERQQKLLSGRSRDLEASLKAESTARSEAQAQIAKLQEQVRKIQYELTEVTRAHTATQALIQDKETQISTLSSRTSQLVAEKDTALRQQSEVKIQLDTAMAELTVIKSEFTKSQEARSQLQADLDETRRVMEAKTSEDAKRMEVQRLKEEELQSLRKQLLALQQELASSKQQSLEQLNVHKSRSEALQKQQSEMATTTRDLASKLSSHEKKLAEVTNAHVTAEKALRAAENDLQGVAQRATTAESSLTSTRTAKAQLEKQLEEMSKSFQELEEAMLNLEETQSAWRKKAEQAESKLAAESRRREELEATVEKQSASIGSFEEHMATREKEFAKQGSELANMKADLKKAESMTHKTVVEHVHVLMHAKRMTDEELKRTLSELDALKNQHKALEKHKAKIMSENEDMTRQLAQWNRSSGGSGVSRSEKTYSNLGTSASKGVTPGGTSNKDLESKVAELKAALQTATSQRDEAQSNARRKDLAFERTREDYEARILELERGLDRSQMAHSNTFQNLQDLVSSSRSLPSDPTQRQEDEDELLRQKLLEELQMGNEALQADIAAKSEMLRSHQMHKAPRTNGSASPAQDRPSWANAANGSSAAALRGHTVLTPSAMKRPSTDLGSMAQSNAAEENQRLQRKVKELQIDLASLSQSAADATQHASSYKSKAEDAMSELKRVKAYAAQLEAQLGTGTTQNGVLQQQRWSTGKGALPPSSSANWHDEKENVERRLRQSQAQFDRLEAK